MNYKLLVKETGNKSAKFNYQVIDESGNVMSERKSNREYVACTVGGAYYFGRIDLISKGEYGQVLKNCAATKTELPERLKIAYK